MSNDLTLAVIAGSVFVIAAVWIAITRRPSGPSAPEPEPLTVRLRPVGEQLGHRFYTAELRASGLPDVVALAACGRWPAVELVSDDRAPSCEPCERALARLEGRDQE